jgi:hypothetical protein
MAIKCARCGREYDATLFEFGRAIRCDCGEMVYLEEGHRERIDADWEALEREIFEAAEKSLLDRERAAAYRKNADRIVALILHSDMPAIDIEREIESLRKMVLDAFPDKEELFEALYVGRFIRLWEQFRPGEDPPFGPQR